MQLKRILIISASPTEGRIIADRMARFLTSHGIYTLAANLSEMQKDEETLVRIGVRVVVGYNEPAANKVIMGLTHKRIKVLDRPHLIIKVITSPLEYNERYYQAEYEQKTEIMMRCANLSNIPDARLGVPCFKVSTQGEHGLLTASGKACDIAAKLINNKLKYLE